MKLRLIMTLSICFTAHRSHASFLARIGTAARITPIPTRCSFATRRPITTRAECIAAETRLKAAENADKLAEHYRTAATKLSILAYDLRTNKPIAVDEYHKIEEKLNHETTRFRAELGTARYAAIIAADAAAREKL